MHVDTTSWQYYAGAPNKRLHMLIPDSTVYGQSILDHDADIQLDLFKSYASHVALYPTWHSYLKETYLVSKLG